VTEPLGDFDWAAARALAAANTRLRPGDLLGGPLLEPAENLPSGPLELELDGLGTLAATVA
jgi:hypothetical protein